MAPIVRNGVDGERELVMARWGDAGSATVLLLADAPEALELQRPLPDHALRIVESGEKEDGPRKDAMPDWDQDPTLAL